MKPQNKLKKLILLKHAQFDDAFVIPPLDTDEQVEGCYDAADEGWALQDAMEEVRESGIETGLKCEWSRNYESKAVGAQIDGSWIGWTYWYGGGKHGEPSAIQWIEEAYDLDCKERQEMKTVREFSKAI